MVVISAFPEAGISKPNSVKLITACSDLTTSLQRSSFFVILKAILIAWVGSYPTNWTSLFLNPQWAQLNEPIMISLKNGILVNISTVSPLSPQLTHKLSIVIGSGFYLKFINKGYDYDIYPIFVYFVLFLICWLIFL